MGTVEKGESTRRLITLLWFLINVAMIGFLVTTFFVGGRIPLALCMNNEPGSGTSNRTVSPTMAPTTPVPTLGPNQTYTPTVSPTFRPTNLNASNSTDGDDDTYYDDGNAGFVMMWSTFLLLSLSVGGTMVLKSSRTPFAVGGFAGVVLVMANLMFLMSATSAGELRRRAALGVANSADEAMLAFCVIEFLLLSAFALVLIRHRDDVLEVKPGMDEVMDPRSFEPAIQGARGI